MNADTDVYKACYWFTGFSSLEIDKKFQLNAYESLVIVTTCLWQDFRQNITLRATVYCFGNFVLLCTLHAEKYAVKG